MNDLQLNQRRWGYHAVAKPKLFEAGVVMPEGWSPTPSDQDPILDYALSPGTFSAPVEAMTHSAPEATHTPEAVPDHHPKPKRKYTRRKAS